MNKVVMQSVTQDGVQHEKSVIVSERVKVGKDILELVSGAMYVEPLTIFREYIQNAADAIDEGDGVDLYAGDESPRIDIYLDRSGRSIRFRDNGAGLPGREFKQRITAFGASKKRGSSARGFRGIGRLAGLGYCQELIFRSKTLSDNKVQEVSWDGRKFKRILQDHAYNGDLEDIVRDITSFASLHADEFPVHFYEVELRGVVRYKNDSLLNVDEIEKYISQVAPVPFHPEFKFTQQIHQHLGKYEADRSYEIFLSEKRASNDLIEPKQVFRPFRNNFLISEKREDTFQDIEFFELKGMDNEVVAIGWILGHSYYGAIPKNQCIKGLRIRSGNIQVGSHDIFSEVFLEPRFSSWTVGEVHTLSQKMIPNGRRDDFEPNIHHAKLRGQLGPYGRKISKLCRSKSAERNRVRLFHIEHEKINQSFGILRQSAVPKSMEESLQKQIGTSLGIMGKVVGYDDLNEHSKTNLESILSACKKELDAHQGNDGKGDSLSHFPNQKQKIYREMIEMIYECSANKVAAQSLIDRILARLSVLK